MDDIEKTSKKQVLRKVIIYFLVWSMFLGTPFSFVMADPALPDPTTAVINPTDISGWDVTGSTLTMNDVANGAVIKWQNFDIGEGAAVQFNQVTNNAYLMNTINIGGVGDGAATNIAGSLTANGNIFVVNPQGLVLAPTAYISANSFVGAAMSVDPEDFVAFANAGATDPKELQFTLDGDGTMQNAGSIVAQNVALMGRTVENIGAIRTTDAQGVIILAAGDTVKLGQDGSDVFVQVAIDNPESIDNRTVNNTGSLGHDDPLTVENETGGNIILAAGDIFTTALPGLASLRAEAQGNLQLASDDDATTTTGDIMLRSVYGQINIDHQVSAGGDLIAQASHDIVATEDISATGDIFLNGDEDGWGDPRNEIGEEYNPIPFGGGDVVAQNITSVEGSIEIRGNAIELNGDVDAYGNLLIAGRSSADADPGDLHDDGGWGDVHAAGTLDAGGNILIMATGQELVWVEDGGGSGSDPGQLPNPGGGNGNSSGRWDSGSSGGGGGNVASGARGQGNGVFHNRGMAGTGNEEGHWEYGDYSFGSIYLDGDVTATGDFADETGDIILMNNTYTAPYVTIKAGRDVVLANGEDAYPPENAEFLTGDTELTIIAGAKDGIDDGKIYAENTTISVTGSKLTLQQDPTLDLADFTFDNQSDTHLTLISDTGSVIADATKPGNAANKWDSIGAQAAGNITLAGDGCRGIQLGDSGITGLALLAGGNVNISGMSVRSDFDYPDGSIDAGYNVNIVVSNDIRLGGGILAGENINLQAGEGCNDDIDVDGGLFALGDVTALAGDDVELGSVYANGALNITSNTSGHGFFGGGVTIKGPVQADTIDIEAGSHVKIWGDATSRGDMVLTANADKDDWIFGDIKAFGDLTSTEGSIELDASENTIHLYGDVTAQAGDVWFKTNVEFEGLDDQFVDAGGMITADGSLKKLNIYWNGEGWAWSDGSLYLHANDDISLAGDVIAAFCCPRDCWSVGGGVSIISDTGSVFTPGKYVDVDGELLPALAIDIIGRSDHFDGEDGVGVDLPFGPGKAAIVIKSAEDLVLHQWADLTACGTYYEPEPIEDVWTVDDRVGVGFLTEERVILDATRDPGDPFDAAIYLGSTDGDVHVGAEVSIMSRELVEVTYENSDIPREGIYIEFDWACVPRGALIVDAYDTVTLGAKFLDSLAEGLVGDRLEVCSRISEWLEDAIGRLPFPEDLTLPEGYNYVMRGSGDTDEPAWVLEEEPFNLGSPLPVVEELQIEGCPALMQAAAGEIGVAAETIQISVRNALAANPNIQPCEACEGLVDSAAVLQDPAGTRLAAMGQLLGQFATGPTPPAPGQMASIRMALAEHVDDGTFYAAAREWDDALAAYVGAAVELGLAQEDTMTALAKYVPADDATLSAYVAARLSELGG